MFVSVALDVPVDRLFTYRVPAALADRAHAGHRVHVPFRGRRRTGVIIERQERPPARRILTVHDVPDAEPVLSPGSARAGAVHGGLLRLLVRRGGGGHAAPRRSGSRAGALPDPGATRAPDAPPATAGKGAGEAARDRVLRLLAASPEGLFLAELLERLGISRSPVTTLAKRGLVTLERVARGPAGGGRRRRPRPDPRRSTSRRSRPRASSAWRPPSPRGPSHASSCSA